MRVRPIRVIVAGQHVRVMYGQTLMHSEEYADAGKAKRAARGYIRAVNTRPMQLEYFRYGKRVIEQVRKVWAAGDGVVSMPTDLILPTLKYPPHFEPHLGDE